MLREESPFFGRNWVDVASMTHDELEYFLQASAAMKRLIKEKRVPDYKLAKDKDLFAALLFYEDSTRTRFSFEIAAQRLGFNTVGFAGTAGTSVKKGESLLDTVDMFECYDMDAIVMRHPLDGAAKAVAEHIRSMEGRVLPVFNGGDGKNEHPTQGLLDTYTIRECCGRLNNLDIGIAVDPKYGRTTHSFPVLLSLFPGNRLHIFSHKDLRMPASLIAFLRSRGVTVREYFREGHQLDKVLPRLDFLYFTRLQRERFEDDAEYYKAREMFRFFLHMMNNTKDHFGLGHPLPLNKEYPSILPNVKRHPKYWAKRQAGNGVPTRAVEMAFSSGLWGHRFNGQLWVPEEVSDRFYEERARGRPKPGRRQRGKKRKKPLDIRPIENGTVIDHVEDNPYVIARLVQLLELDRNRNRYRSGVVEPIDRPGESKGVLMINDRSLTEDELRLVATVAPGSTVNYISGRKVVKKLDMYLPGSIEGLPGQNCTNHRCITRPEYFEDVTPKAVRLDKGLENIVKCHYCNNVMRSDEMFAANENVLRKAA